MQINALLSTDNLHIIVGWLDKFIQFKGDPPKNGYQVAHTFSMHIYWLKKQPCAA